MPNSLKVLGKRVRKSSAKYFRRRHQFAAENFFILLFLGATFQPLPWQCAAQEVHEHHTKTFQVIPPALLNAEVVVNTGVTRCACQVLAFAVLYMPACALVNVRAAQAIVHQIN